MTKTETLIDRYYRIAIFMSPPVKNIQAIVVKVSGDFDNRELTLVEWTSRNERNSWDFLLIYSMIQPINAWNVFYRTTPALFYLILTGMLLLLCRFIVQRPSYVIQKLLID